ncbi:MAG: YtxH domain-containing protein [Parafilimonas sp.]|nr:YtxH domain-containing protein [Parafilimonas sp.]
MHFRTFVNGVLVGILLGVLFAPDSGEETRKKISRRAQGLKDTYDDFADNVSNTYNKVRDKASDIVSQTKNKLNSSKGEAESMYDI